ncbi:MAG: hypothetical protein IT428_05970, partial [Planctomycetaceae bacterium]|nr:hypothetical protein [Planctomycetaceae bacterium]
MCQALNYHDDAADRVSLSGRPRRQANYEGNKTTGSSRVSRGRVQRAKKIIGRATSAKTIRRRLGENNLLTGERQLRRNAAPKTLSGSQLTNRAASRRARRNAGTAAGKKRTREVLAAARNQIVRRN